ncbi:MAG: EamA family transporter RarD [Cellvibrionaceae bacterium]
MSRSQQGGLLAIAAFVFWGAFPFYFKLVSHINPLEVLANRVIWAAFFLCFLLVVLRSWRKVVNAFRDGKQCLFLLLATVLIALNWGTYIWSVTNDRLFEASLGYYINPLLNVFLGFVLLNEKLRFIQWLAVLLAVIGVSIEIIALGKVPWVALILAFSFGFYGFIHKNISVDSISGLFVETLLLLPLAFIYLAVLSIENNGPVVWSTQDWLLLVVAGPVTIIPLLLFTSAAKRITYSSLGFFQYITPSILFLLATFYYNEPFSLLKLVTFGFIWLALILLSIDIVKQQSRSRMGRGE